MCLYVCLADSLMGNDLLLLLLQWLASIGKLNCLNPYIIFAKGPNYYDSLYCTVRLSLLSGNDYCQLPAVICHLLEFGGFLFYI